MRVWSLIGLVCILGVSCLSAQAYRLQFKDTEGTVREYKTQVNLTATVAMGSITAPVDTTMNMTAVEKVTKVTNGKASISYQLKNGKASVKVSNLPGEEGPQNIDQKLPDYTILFDRTPLGTVSNLKTAGEASSIFGGGPSALNNQFMNPTQGFAFPDKDLQPGDTWDTSQSIPMGEDSKLDVTATYTLVGEQLSDTGKKYLQINVDLTMNLPKFAVKAGQGEMAMDMVMSMNLKAHEVVLFDADAGELYQLSSKMSGVTTTTIPGQDGDPMKMTLDATIKETKAAKAAK